VDAASRRVNYRYDILNRCINTVYADGSTESFTFDAVGNLLTAKNAATTKTFAYERAARGRKGRETVTRSDHLHGHRLTNTGPSAPALPPRGD